MLALSRARSHARGRKKAARLPADVFVTGDVHTQGSSWALVSSDSNTLHGGGQHQPVLTLLRQHRGQETRRRKASGSSGTSSPGDSSSSMRDRGTNDGGEDDTLTSSLASPPDHGHRVADCAHDYVYEDEDDNQVGRTRANRTSRAQSKNRRARKGPKSRLHTECRIFADADAYFFNRWKGDCTLTKQMLGTRGH